MSGAERDENGRRPIQAGPGWLSGTIMLVRERYEVVGHPELSWTNPDVEQTNEAAPRAARRTPRLAAAGDESTTEV